VTWLTCKWCQCSIPKRYRHMPKCALCGTPRDGVITAAEFIDALRGVLRLDPYGMRGGDTTCD